MECDHANRIKWNDPFEWGGVKKFNLTELSSIKFGTTEVWKKQTDFYPGATVSHLSVNVGSYGSFYTNCSGVTNINSTVVYIPINLTGISTLHIVGSTTRSGTTSYAGAFLKGSVPSGNDAYPYYTVGQGSSSSYYEKMDRHVNTSGSFDWTWDVSGLTGTHYLCLGCYFNGASTGSAGITVTSVYGI